MADIIKVDTSALDGCVRSLDAMASDLDHYSNALSPGHMVLESIPNIICNVILAPVSQIHSLVSLVHTAQTVGTLYAALSSARTAVSCLEDTARDLSDKVKLVSMMFEDVENQVLNDGRSMGTPDPFDSSGQNGGNQSHAMENTSQFDDFRRIIERNTGMTFADDNELKAWLEHMSSTGCGYVAMTNAIFAAFIGREEEFEATFGYPMYGPDGDFNFDCLLVDFYSHANHGEGIFVNEQARYIQDFCSEHGINAEVTVHSNQMLTAAEYREMINRGEITNGQIAVTVGDPFALLNMDGTPYHTWENSAHVMTVIGTRGNYLIVSSWGETFLLDPSESNSWSTGNPINNYGYISVEVH